MAYDCKRMQTMRRIRLHFATACVSVFTAAAAWIILCKPNFAWQVPVWKPNQYTTQGRVAAFRPASEIAKHRGPVIAAAATTTIATPVTAASLEVLEGVLQPHEVEAALETLRATACAFHTDPDSVDGLPSFERYFIMGGQWCRNSSSLKQVLGRPLEHLLKHVRVRHREDLAVSDALVRRYVPGERRFHPLHYDHHAMVTAVGSLTHPKPNSGLFVQSGAHADSREFVALGVAGNFAVHEWDLAHGVDVQSDEERYSLIVWFKPHSDVSSGTTSWYDALAAEGHQEAQYRLGKSMQTKGDIVSAEHWFEQAAAQGHWASMFHLARLLLRRHEVENARKWLSAAARLGWADAQVELANLVCKESDGCSIPAEARLLYGQAAEQGHPAGQHFFALALFGAGQKTKGQSVLRQAAEQGWADSQFELGCRLQKASAPASECAKWFERAAAKGNVAAMNRLAVMESDDNAAREWLMEAAKRGSIEAMNSLALQIEQGRIEHTDPEAANKLREMAKERLSMEMHH